MAVGARFSGNAIDCAQQPAPAIVGLKVGGVAALVGGALGALAGYRERYVLAPTETASAR